MLKECSTRSVHKDSELSAGQTGTGKDDILDDIIKDIRFSGLLVRDSGGRVRPIDHACVPVILITSSAPLAVIRREFQSLCSALRSPAIKMGTHMRSSQSRPGAGWVRGRPPRFSLECLLILVVWQWPPGPVDPILVPHSDRCPC
jgi:hypothetical protein